MQVQKSTKNTKRESERERHMQGSSIKKEKTDRKIRSAVYSGIAQDTKTIQVGKKREKERERNAELESLELPSSAVTLVRPLVSTGFLVGLAPHSQIAAIVHTVSI